MAGHGPAVKLGKDNASAWKSKVGIRLFWLYCLVYAGFVAITVIRPKAMGKPVLMGVNLAITYGVGLIVFAVVLGMIYNHFCTRKEIELNSTEQGE